MRLAGPETPGKLLLMGEIDRTVDDNGFDVVSNILEISRKIIECTLIVVSSTDLRGRDG